MIRRMVVDGLEVQLPSTKVELSGTQQLVFDDPLSRRIAEPQRRRVFRGDAQRTVRLSGTSSTLHGTPRPVPETSTIYALPLRHLSLPLLAHSCGYGERTHDRDELSDEQLLRYVITRDMAESRMIVVRSMGADDIDCMADQLDAARTGNRAKLPNSLLVRLLSPLGRISAEVDDAHSMESRMMASSCPGAVSTVDCWRFAAGEFELQPTHLPGQAGGVQFEGVADAPLNEPEPDLVVRYLHILGLMPEWEPLEQRAHVRVDLIPDSESRVQAEVRLLLDPVEPVLRSARLVARFEFHWRIAFGAHHERVRRQFEVDLDVQGECTTTVEEGREHVAPAVEGAGVHRFSYYR